MLSRRQHHEVDWTLHLTGIMAFRFPLESVLQYRRSQEHQQELRLRAVSHRVSSLRLRIVDLEKRFAELRIRQSDELKHGTTAAELVFLMKYETSLQGQHRRLKRDLERLEDLRQQHQQAFLESRRERETLENLKAGEAKAYECEHQRREQRQFEDLFLLRRAYLRHS